MVFSELTSGLQELLTDGSFVDVRISCSDHTPSDGLGSHRAMLAAASPQLLSNCLDTGDEEDMICLLLPDFSSSVVASVLSVLYYGETWMSHVPHHIAAVNSLFRALGMNLEVVNRESELVVISRDCAKSWQIANFRPSLKDIKKEPTLGNTPAATIPPGSYNQLLNIKKEIHSELQTVPSIPTVQTATVEAASLLKCPNKDCGYHSSSIPEMQAHIAKCTNALEPIAITPMQHVEVKLNLLGIKRESNIKQESIDPLTERSSGDASVTLPKEHDSETQKLFSALRVETMKTEFDDADTKSISTINDSEDVDIKSISDSCESVDQDHNVCSQCPYISNSKSAMQAHTIMHQRKEMLKANRTTCPKCGTDCKSLQKFKDHLVKEHAKRVKHVVHCNIDKCVSSFAESRNSKLKFYHHVLYDHYGAQYKFKCLKCDYKSTSSSKLKEHIMSHEDERPFSCQECGQQFRTNSKLSEHFKLIHQKNSQYDCSQCDQSFVLERQLKRHVATKHSSGKLTCKDCSKEFSSEAERKQHRKTEHRYEKKRDLICEKCAYELRNCKCNANSRKETGATVFCPVCGKQMAARLLSGHLHYHRQSSLRPYICQECSKTFTHAASLKRHAQLHLGEKKFTCEDCGKQFHQKTAYQTHKKSHTSERIPCNACGTLFLTQYLLNFHLKSKKVCRAHYNMQ